MNGWIFVVAAAAGLVGTWLVRNYAMRTNLLDIPNQRSSHQGATPRGGGLAIALVFLGGLLGLFFLDVVPTPVFLSLLSGGLLVAGVGFADDHGHVPARWRSAVHFLAAIVALTLLGGMPTVQFGGAVVDLGLFGDALAVVFIVWMINLFNFMDGIDGIAAVEVIFVAAGGWWLAALPEGSFVGSLLALLIASTAGFLAWNWPPAKIFMGDAGSGFVGFVLGTLALVTYTLGIMDVWPWLILAGVFFVDATVTLLVRIATGQTWYEAHNSHAYQKASRRVGGHAPVTIALLLLNVMWLLPIAWFANKSPQHGWWLMLLAWGPLIVLALGFGAGQVDKPKGTGSPSN
jgi:Fuc2NAc and GlcNAc transferase